MRLGQGELTMHYRRPEIRRIECGVTYGCITAVLEDVTCTNCTEIAQEAAILATKCGCRDAGQHAPVARAMREIAAAECHKGSEGS